MSLSCTLDSIQSLGASSCLVRLRPAKELDFRAGQYLKLAIMGGGKRAEGYFSIASPPGSPALELIVGPGAPGSAAARLRNLAPGEQVMIEGPFRLP